MRVLRRWSDSAAFLTGFDPQPVRDVALGNCAQHLLLSLWAYADQRFCFKDHNGKLYIGLVKAATRRRRRRAGRRR